MQDAVPQRKDFGEAGAEGDAVHAAAMKDFSLSALGDSGMSEGRKRTSSDLRSATSTRI